MKITHNLTIDLQRRGNLQKIDVVQGDTYTRLVNISLYNNGVLWDVPTDSGILVRYHKPDGTSGIYEELPDGSPAGAVDGNGVLITLAPQMLTAPGKVSTQVSIVVDDQVLSTFSFIVDVEEDTSKGAVGSENYYNWKSAFIPQTKDAHVGQYLEITKVDSRGRIEEVKSVANPAINAELAAGEAKRIAQNADFNANEALESADVAKNLAIRNSDDIETLSSSKLPQVTGAKAGQYIKITEVDDIGRVVAFEAVNAPTSGSISGDIEMQGDAINNVGSLSFTGPNNTSVDGFWIQSGTAASKEDGSKTSVAEFYSSDTDEGVVIRNVAPGVEDSDAVNLAQLSKKISSPIGEVKVGQTIVVKTVDETGKPTEWESVDFPSGGGGSEEWDILLNVTTETDVASVSTTVPPEGHSFDEYTEAVVLMFIRPNSGGYNTDIKMNLNGTNPWNGKFGFSNTGISDTSQVGRLSMLHVRKCSFGWIPVLWAHSYNGGTINAGLIPQSNVGTTLLISATYASGKIPEDMTTIMPNYPISAVAIGGYQQVLGAGSKIIVYGKRNG